MAKITWRGEELKAKVRTASAMGVEKVTSDCVHQARSDHAAFPPASEPGEPFANRTTFAEQSIRSKPVEVDADRVSGRWGGYANYFLFLEIGTSREGSGEPSALQRELAAGGNVHQVSGPSDPPLMAARPTLRPAADSFYPLLRAYIAQAMRGEGF